MNLGGCVQEGSAACGSQPDHRSRPEWARSRSRRGRGPCGEVCTHGRVAARDPCSRGLSPAAGQAACTRLYKGTIECPLVHTGWLWSVHRCG